MEKREKLGAEIHFLGRVLGDIIREQAGPALYDLEEEIRLGARARREGRDGAERALRARIHSMSDAEARTVVRAFTVFFDLQNLAEDRERVRVLRERERSRYPEPRSESMEGAALLMRSAGLDPERTQALLDLLSIGLVFTAHPTEAKRRSVRTKVRLLRQTLVLMDDAELLPREKERLVARLRSLLTGLWQTDLVRPRRPSVLEEVEVGLYFASTLWEVAPVIHSELKRALEKVYPGTSFRLPPFLGFGSWIGGDRDGNPHVSAKVTEATLLRMRTAAVDAHLGQCRFLLEELTSSEKQVAVSWELRQAVERRSRDLPEIAGLLEPFSPFEIYRRFLKTIEWRLQQTRAMASIDQPRIGAYREGSELAADLALIRDSLRLNKGEHIADGELQNWIEQTEVFGLHFARLDIRQESGRNTRVVAEVLRHLGLAEEYTALPETGKRALLGRTMGAAGGVPRTGLSADARETLAVFDLLRSAARSLGEEALGGHVISMTHSLSDILAALWLMEMKGGAGDEIAPSMDIVPLFETIQDLAHAEQIVRDMLDDPSYRRHLARRNNVQTIMIGYSDSTKDGGYLAACWALYDAQSVLSRVAQERGVRVIFFHGRGGSLGRGGGPAARSILALPPESLGAGLRMTEQGEVLADRYDDPRVAGRHLEQVIWATVAASVKPLSPPPPGMGGGDAGAGSRSVHRVSGAHRRALLPLLLRTGHADPRDRIPPHCIAARASPWRTGHRRPARHPLGIRVDPESLHDPGLVRDRKRLPGLYPQPPRRGQAPAGDVRGVVVLPCHSGQCRARPCQVGSGYREDVRGARAGAVDARADMGHDRRGVRKKPGRRPADQRPA
jgi:phosphoenolpyruvate carboxylase